MMLKRKYISRERLCGLLHYNPDTGIFRWLVSRGKAKVGSVAGTLDGDGYIQIQIDKVQYKAHNLAFLYMLGRWPNPSADHIDVTPANNEWVNLREATQSQQISNQKKSIKNTSGFKGVSFNRKSGKWHVSINVNKNYIWVGYFDTPQEGYIAYCETAKKLLGEFARVV